MKNYFKKTNTAIRFIIAVIFINAFAELLMFLYYIFIKINTNII